MKLILILMLLFPLAGGVFNAVFGRLCRRRVVERVACGAAAGAFVMALLGMPLAGGRHLLVTLYTWFHVGDLVALVDVNYDPLAAVMALTVTFVSALIHFYSVGYMREDAGHVRYFALLNLFVFSMLVITLADNMVFLFLGWEGVGFCSYGLIGFWHQKGENADAGRKAFLLTRIGDVGYMVAMAMAFAIFGDMSITYINGHVGHLSSGTITLMALLLFWAAAGKSAQLPLSVWLPDAMAGPTPVSALIHAATMVTAGLYLLMRFFPLISLSSAAMTIIATVGVLTAFYAACAALVQRDIKRVLAYSTISQLGYMFLGLGAGDLTGGMFHLMTHAFFKSLLFLGAGCVIQALHEEQDITRMGAPVRKALPGVFWPFLAGAAALAALPPTAGFFSKDQLLIAVFTHPDGFYKALWGVATLTALLTALYTFRLVFFVFFGGGKADEAVHSAGAETAGDPAAGPTAGPTAGMIQALWPLGALALIAGLINLPAALDPRPWLSGLLMTVGGPAARHGVFGGGHGVSHALEARMAFGNGLLAVAGLVVAYFLYGPKGSLRDPDRAPAYPRLMAFLRDGFELDRLYGALLVRPFRQISEILWRGADVGGVDRGLTAAARGILGLADELRLWTTGRLSTYLAMLFAGLGGIACYLLFI